MQIGRYLLAAGFVAASCNPVPGQTVPQCAEQTVMAENLLKHYGEVPRVQGIINARAMMQVYASEAKGTWSAVITEISGRACIVSAGSAFSTIDAAPPGEPG